jgi:hypothetical protein
MKVPNGQLCIELRCVLTSLNSPDGYDIAGAAEQKVTGHLHPSHRNARRTGVHVEALRVLIHLSRNGWLIASVVRGRTDACHRGGGYYGYRRRSSAVKEQYHLESSFRVARGLVDFDLLCQVSLQPERPAV